ncbi:GPN-loop GTPase 1-like [Oppia nitens]|uniref:GPN-loop GTPase 1-like n=1 Tax=Oppia nitens TaxID=1686743 RepID=UPI0023DB4196|nr:GPN-loop GTPase 1-like [Oppia nitens]
MATNDTTGASNSSTTDETVGSDVRKPVCVIILGMAGSGKSTLCGRVGQHLFMKKSVPYVINCDPAVLKTPFPANIDIRDTVNYKEVMKKYNLGPNGAIITCLNLFATQLDQVIQLIDKRADNYEYVLFDTPGQIEVFTWSASGAIMTEALASRYPTVIVYVMDTIRSENPVTFMSNMLYACSVVYKYKLPIIIAMNKCDAIDCKFAMDWMRDWQLFESAIEKETSYMANLTRSMSLVLDTFYENLTAVGVSATTGQGMDDLINAIKAAAVEYENDYRPEYERIKREAQMARSKEREKQLLKVKQKGTTEKEELMTFGDPSATAYRERRDDEDSDDDSDHNCDLNDEEEDEEEKREYKEFKKTFVS